MANCGNGVVDVGETCDDGNTVSGDGCSSTCQLETGFLCMAGTPAETCYCNPHILSARWIDYWGAIEIRFKGNVYYNGTATRSSDPKTFCEQMLNATMITALQANYTCYLHSNKDISTALVYVGEHSNFGYTGSTILETINLHIEGCNGTILPNISILNLPIPTPEIVYTNAYTTYPKCQPLSLHFQSKGLTRRAPTITWTATAILPANPTALANLNTALAGSENLVTLDAATVEPLAGHQVTFQTTLQNFLNKTGTNTTDIVFQTTTNVVIEDML